MQDGSLTTREAFDGMGAMQRRQVRIPLNHGQRFPAAEILDGQKVDAFHSQPGGWS